MIASAGVFLTIVGVTWDEATSDTRSPRCSCSGAALPDRGSSTHSPRASADRVAFGSRLGVVSRLAEVDVGVGCVRRGPRCFVEPEPLVKTMQRRGRPPVALTQH